MQASPSREPGALASDPALPLHSVCEALRSFFIAVSSPDALPEFQAIQQPRLRSEAVSRCGDGGGWWVGGSGGREEGGTELKGSGYLFLSARFDHYRLHMGTNSVPCHAAGSPLH